MSSENVKKKLQGLYWILLSVTLIIAVIIILYFTKFDGDFSNQHEIWGTFGDFIGRTLNPILSFFSFMALLLTINLQNQELEATREELERSATAQENSEKSLKKQLKILNQQQFESTFFAILEQHNSVLEELSVEKRKIIQGEVINFSSIEDVRDELFSIHIKMLEESKQNLEQNNDLCGHYFRILYQLLKFISINIPESKITTDFKKQDICNKPLVNNEKMYSNIVRSFLNHDVIQVLSVNCYCNEQSIYWKYKLLLERYAFLEHMSFKLKDQDQENSVLVKTKSFYNKSAFGNSIF